MYYRLLVPGPIRLGKSLPGKVGEKPTTPLGFNTDGSEPAPQGPYYTGRGQGEGSGTESQIRKPRSGKQEGS